MTADPNQEDLKCGSSLSPTLCSYLGPGFLEGLRCDMELVPKTPSVLISKIEGKKSMFSKFFWVPKVVFYQPHATVDLTS